MVLVYFYPKTFQNKNEKNMLIFSICSYLIVAIAICCILYSVIRLYEQQRKELEEVNKQLYFMATHLGEVVSKPQHFFQILFLYKGFHQLF